MKRPVFRTTLALAALLFAAACEQPAGTGNKAAITLRTAADVAKIGVDAAYPLDGDYTLAENLTLDNWTPIGTYGARFAGTFNGGGKTLTINGSGGLFAFAGDAVIQNLRVAGTITKTGDSDVAMYVGGIVGFADNTAISSCVSTAAITVEGHGHNSSAGGIAGYLREKSTITGCSATGAITLRSGAGEGLMLYAGGIAGYQGTGYAGEGNSECAISRSYFTGSVTAEGGYPYAGGIAGYNYCGSAIRECYSQGGTVTARGENIPYAGGISGYNSQTPVDPALIENCHSSMTVSAVAASKQALAGGITGANAADATVSNCYALGAVSAVIDSGSAGDDGGSLGVPGAASAGGIAGAQYFNAPSIKNCVALNSSITGSDLSGASYNVHRIAGPGTGEQGSAWESNLANTAALVAGGSAVTSQSNAAGPDGADCAAKPNQAAYEALGWDFASVWKMAADGYPVLQWQ